MSELLTATLAVFSGVLVYVLGQMFVRLIIEPYKNISQAIEEAVFVAFTYDTVTPSVLDISDSRDHERMLEARKAFREKGSRLVASVSAFTAYSYLESIINIPTKNDLMLAGQSLLEMSNLIGNAHSGNELEELSQYKYLLANRLGVKLAKWENVKFDKISELLRAQ